MFGFESILNEVKEEEGKQLKQIGLTSSLDLHENDEEAGCKCLPSLEDGLISLLAKGLLEDLSTLLNGFYDLKELRFKNFLDVWKSMNFSNIFYGKSDYKYLRLFTLASFKLTLKYVDTVSTVNCLKPVGALYCLYCLYNSQVSLPKIRIPITIEKWEYLKEIAEEALSEFQYDVYYCFMKLQFQEAFDIVAVQSIEIAEFSVHFSKELLKKLLIKRKLNVNDISDDFDESIYDTVGISTDIIDDLHSISNNYQAHKMELMPERDTFAISYASENFCEKFFEKMTKFEKAQHGNITEDLLDSDEEYNDIFGLKLSNRLDKTNLSDEVENEKSDNTWLPSNSLQHKGKSRRMELRDKAFKATVEESNHRRGKRRRSDRELNDDTNKITESQFDYCQKLRNKKYTT